MRPEGVVDVADRVRGLVDEGQEARVALGAVDEEPPPRELVEGPQVAPGREGLGVAKDLGSKPVGAERSHTFERLSLEISRLSRGGRDPTTLERGHLESS